MKHFVVISSHITYPMLGLRCPLTGFRHVHLARQLVMPGGWQVSMKVMLWALDSHWCHYQAYTKPKNRIKVYHFRFQHVHRLKSFGMPGGWQVSMKVMLRALDSVSAGDLIDPDSDQWSPGPAGSLQLVIRLESNRVAHLITPCTNSVTEPQYSRFFLIDAIDWKLF